MSRNSWIMFGMIAVVIISIVLVALFIFVPQSEPIIESGLEEYEGIDRKNYLYTQSKDISQEAMKETYSITPEDVKEGKASKLYKQGNTDPFAEIGGTTNENGGNTSSGSNSSGNTNQGTTSGGNQTTNDKPISAEDK